MGEVAPILFREATRPTHQPIASSFLLITELAFRLMPAINPPIRQPIIFVRQWKGLLADFATGFRCRSQMMSNNFVDRFAGRTRRESVCVRSILRQGYAIHN
jgi:hypothetical protein